MPPLESALYVPYAAGPVWVVRHAHTVVAQHASRREAIQDAQRRAAASSHGPANSQMIHVHVQADDGSWHVLDLNDPADCLCDDTGAG